MTGLTRYEFKPEDVKIRPAVKEDFPYLAYIDKEGFRKPFREEDYYFILARPSVHALTALVRGHVAGYLLFKNLRKAQLVLSLAVLPCFRRKGIGKKLLGKLRPARKGHRTLAFVRETDLDAQLFFKACDFKCVRVEKGRAFADTGEPAYRFEQTFREGKNP